MVDRINLIKNMLYLRSFSIRLDFFKKKITINYILLINILINVYCGDSDI